MKKWVKIYKVNLMKTVIKGVITPFLQFYYISVNYISLNSNHLIDFSSNSSFRIGRRFDIVMI